MGTIVICKRGYVGSYFYVANSINELNKINNALSLIDIDGLQLVTRSRIEAYGEYQPAKQISSIVELFGVVNKLASLD